MTDRTMTCAEFQALASDSLEPHALPAAQRAAADAHVASCVECAALVADLRTIVRDAGELPVLTPSRDLWSGIEERIEAPVVALPRQTADGGRQTAEVGQLTADDGRQTAEVGQRTADDGRRMIADRRLWRLAIAASILVVATAGITYTITRRGAATSLASGAGAGSPTAVPGAPALRTVVHASAEETFDYEIAVLRKIVDARRAELDSATIRIVETNLRLIDAAIAESKAALAQDPASTFLLDRVTRAYGTKLQLLRGLATLPART